MKAIFWAFVAADVGALGLWFLLALAAATATKTSPLTVAAFILVVPGLFLLLATLLFARSKSAAGRVAAILLTASPWISVFALQKIEQVKIRLNSDSNGKLTFFGAGPMREIAEAIARNDAATVAALAPRADVNGAGYSGMTLLTLACRQLRKTPQDQACLAALLRAGADPNIASHGGADESPLLVAIEISSKAGPKPVEMLLAAGANPNAKTIFGEPVYFVATGSGREEILGMLLEHGADVHARDRDGRTVVFQAAAAGNWKAVLMLLQRGAGWKGIRGISGGTLLDTAESDLRVYGDKGGLAEVIAFLKRSS